jgi:organic radical activating enzyme
MTEIDFNSNLYISQIFNSVQGEGDTIGTPAKFLRLQGCNLMCPICDTKYTWQIKKDNDNVITCQNVDQFLVNVLLKDQLPLLVITGGEPFLYRYNKLFWLIIEEHVKRNIKIEIETNSILVNNTKVLNKLKQYDVKLNISPKLDKNCYYYDLEDYESLQFVNKYIIKNYTDNYIYKFIHDKPSEMKILKFISDCDINNDKVYIMPKTKDAKTDPTLEYFYDLIYRHHQTIEFCLQNKLKLSARLQTFLFSSDISEKLLI